MTRLLSLIQLLLIASTAFAQLRLDSSISKQDLILKHLLKESSGVIISNVQFTGLKQSIAAFENESPEELIDAGIILSTGDVFDALGPNKARNTGTKASARRDDDLQAIATGVVTDAVVLEFDLIALRDSIAFTYVFASEEYPEYVDKGVNDVFGFFISEIDGRSIRPLNIARLPNSREKVTIDNVNHRRNEEYFLRSDFLTAHSDEFWKKNKPMMMRARIFEYDGFTVPLKAVARLKEGKKYHLKIALADVGDRYYDSAVLIKAKSFSAEGPKVKSADSIVSAEVKKRMKDSPGFACKNELAFSMQVNFKVNEAEIQSESIAPLSSILQLMNEFGDLKIEIIGHTDNDGSDLDNKILSEERAKSVRNYLIQQGVNESRLLAKGLGELEPLNENVTEKEKAINRRVEFKLSY